MSLVRLCQFETPVRPYQTTIQFHPTSDARQAWASCRMPYLSCFCQPWWALTVLQPLLPDSRNALGRSEHARNEGHPATARRRILEYVSTKNVSVRDPSSSMSDMSTWQSRTAWQWPICPGTSHCEDDPGPTGCHILESAEINSTLLFLATPGQALRGRGGHLAPFVKERLCNRAVRRRERQGRGPNHEVKMMPEPWKRFCQALDMPSASQSTRKCGKERFFEPVLGTPLRRAI